MLKLATLTPLLLVSSVAYAQPGATEPITPDADAPSEAPGTVEATPYVAPSVTVRPPVHDPLATTRRWGFAARATGLSGIGALPGVNYGGELAGQVRHDELFAELALGRWKPKKTYMVNDGSEQVELGLNVWTVRAGWGVTKMPGVVTRMMMGSTPVDRRWKALGAGFGVAWPMTDTARLFGMVEFAVPVTRNEITLDGYGTYQPDPLTARSSVGLEIGWR